MKKVQINRKLPPATIKKLEELATQQKRSQAVVLEILIDKEYEREIIK